MARTAYTGIWYACTVHDCIFGNFLSKCTVYIPCIYRIYTVYIWPGPIRVCSVLHTDSVYLGLARTIYIYTVYIRYFWQENHQIYGHIRCIYIRFWPTLSIPNAGLHWSAFSAVSFPRSMKQVHARRPSSKPNTASVEKERFPVLCTKLVFLCYQCS